MTTNLLLPEMRGKRSKRGKRGGQDRPTNAPTTTGKPSGGGQDRPANAPSTTGKPSGGGRGNNPPRR